MNLNTILKKNTEELTEQDVLALLDFFHENIKPEKVREAVKYNLIFGATEKEETEFKNIVKHLYYWSRDIYKKTLSREFIQKFIQVYSSDLEGFYHEYSKIATIDSKYSEFLNNKFKDIRKYIFKGIRYNERKEYIPIIKEVYSKLDSSSYLKLTEDEILNICRLISVYHNNGMGKEINFGIDFLDDEFEIMAFFEDQVLEWTRSQSRQGKIVSEKFIDELERMRFSNFKFLPYKKERKNYRSYYDYDDNELLYWIAGNKRAIKSQKIQKYVDETLPNMNEVKILEMLEGIYQNLQTIDKLHEKDRKNNNKTREENLIYEKNVDDCYLEMDNINKAIYEWNNQMEKDALITQMVIESDNKVKYFSDDFISKFEEITDKILKDYKYKYRVLPTFDHLDFYEEKRDVGTIESLGHIARRINDQQEASDLLYVSKMKEDEFLEMLEKTYVFLIENKDNHDYAFINKGKNLLFLLKNYFKNTREKTTESKDFYYNNIEGKTEISINKFNKIVNKYNKENELHFYCYFYSSLNKLAQKIKELVEKQQIKIKD